MNQRRLDGSLTRQWERRTETDVILNVCAECCESSIRADMRRETVPDSRSSSAKGTGART